MILCITDKIGYSGLYKDKEDTLIIEQRCYKFTYIQKSYEFLNQPNKNMKSTLFGQQYYLQVRKKQNNAGLFLKSENSNSFFFLIIINCFDLFVFH